MMMKPKDHDHDETAPAERFSRLSLCKKQENQFPMTSSVCLYSNISWATVNHSARSIHYIVQKDNDNGSDDGLISSRFR